MKYLNAFVKRLVSFLYCLLIKIFHPINFSFSRETMLSPSVSISMTNNGKISVGNKVGIRKGSSISAHCGSLHVGDNVFINTGCVISSHKNIAIGKGTRFGPYCMLFDHDYDFRDSDGFVDGKHLVSDIVIGENVWVGAGVIILRGTSIGNNTVIAAGCVVKGFYPENSLILQRRNEECKSISKKKELNDTSITCS